MVLIEIIYIYIYIYLFIYCTCVEITTRQFFFFFVYNIISIKNVIINEFLIGVEMFLNVGFNLKSPINYILKF